jgi:predicted AlkP superfamily pyrophosphatase or phosphodiesterase
VLVLAALAVTGCRAQPAGNRAPVVLVSLDGFSAEYLERGLTPTLAGIAANGVRARALVPVFPTKTFPNHFSMATGRYPAQHGIVGNEFTAPDLRARFDMRDRAAVRDPRFWLAEPIWVTAERRGLRTAPYFWPGSEAAIRGRRPTFWPPYRHDMPDSTRVRLVLDRLDEIPPAALVTLYLSGVDAAGHDHGPGSSATDSAIAAVDRVIGRLVAGIEARGRPVNLLIVSDHGMAATSPARTIVLDDLVRRSWLDHDELSPVLMAWPRPGFTDSVITGLRRAPHLTVYRRGELPARWRLRASDRVAPVVAIADEGWTIAWRPGSEGEMPASLGNHGYDDSLPSMAGIFIAQGPAFERGVTAPAFRSVQVYAILARLLGLSSELRGAGLDSVPLPLRQ